MATKKPATRQPTLDDLIAGGYRYTTVEDAPQEPEQAQPEKSSLARRALGDTGVALAKGAIGVPEALVGMADIATGGRVGKFLENEDGMVGFRPEQARQFLDQYLSPEQQAANQAVQQADGFMGKLGAAVTNPSTIWQGAVESAPSMLGGGAVARGILKVAPKVGAPLAVGAGEGAFSAGATAEQVRQQTEDGLLTGKQAAIAAGSGAATGVLGVIGTKVAQKLGIGDVDALVAGFSTATPKVQKGVVRSMLEGAVAEGVLEELPQSVQEQVAQNLALGKPLEDGVDYAAVMGMLSGGLMGGIAAPLATGTPAGKAIRDEKMPEVGPLTKALNAATEQRAQAADAGKPTLTADQVTVQAQQRLAELDQKAKGTKDEQHPGPDGKPVTIPGQPAQFLTDAERQERDFLTQNATNPEALAQAQGATISPYQRQPDAAIPGALPPDTALARMEDMAKQQAQADRGAAFAADAAARPAPAEPAPAPASVADDAALPPEPTDILNPKSNAPWKSRTQAVAAQKKTPGTVLASVAGGYVLRPLKEPTDGGLGISAEPGLAGGSGVGPADAGGSLAGDGRPADAPAGAVPEGTAAGAAPAGDAGVAAGNNDPAVAADVAGDPIDGEWTAFKPETGTKAVPRADMPQIKAEHRGAMTQFLKARGIAHEQEQDVDPASLKPTQAEFSPGKVQKAREFTEGDRAILVSNDGHILDGHHQWLAAREDGKPIRVIRFDAPIEQLMAQAKEFPSSTTAEGAAEPATALAEQQRLFVDGPDGKKYPVRDVREAQELWTQFRDAAGEGVSKLGNGVRVVDQNGKFVARVSYNGRAWSTEDDGKGGGQVIAEAPAPVEPKLDTPAPAPAPAVKDTPQSRWTRMPEADRLGVLGKAGWSVTPPSLSTQRMLRIGWDKMSENQRQRIAAAMESPATAQKTDATDTQAPQAPSVEAAPVAPGDAARGDAAGQGAVPGAPAAAAAQTAGVERGKTTGKKETKQRKPSPVERAHAAREAKRAAYFTPGNIVRGYGGYDEVLAYSPSDENGRWSVKVHHVKKFGDEWVREGKPQDARQHSTEPEARELASGPVARLPALPASEVRYTEPRADGKPFPNALPRGVAKADAVTGEVQAVHKDPGEPAEPATPAVVKEALQTAARNDDRPIKDVKADALRLIDEAIAKAQSSEEIDAQIGVNPPKTIQGKKVMTGVRRFTDDKTVMVEARETRDGKWSVTDESYDGSGTGRKRRTELGELQGTPAVAREQLMSLLRRLRADGTLAEPDMVTINVPGDGEFKVVNTKERLAEFRRKVENSPGFKDQRPGPIESLRVNGYGSKQSPGAPFGVEGGSGSKADAFANMVDEGDIEAALNYAEAVGIDPAKAKLPDVLRKRLDKWMADNKDRAPEPELEPETAPAPTPAPSPEQPKAERASPKTPATAQAAIDAFNADDSAQAMAIVARLRLDDLKTVGNAIGFPVNFTENAAGYRKRLEQVADRLTKTNRETAARERALFDKLTDRAMDFDRMKEHMERAKGLGNTDPDSTAFQTGYKPMDGGESKWMRIPEAMDLLAADVRSLKGDPDYAKVSEMVRKARPGVFDAADASAAPNAEPQQQPEKAEKQAPKAERLTDAGEELIRNRRGKLKGLAWDDVSAMNDTLKVAQVVKANVWPRPDYAKMVEDGAPAWKAAALKAVYDKLAAAPVTRAAPTDADLRAYIETMHAVRDALTAELDRVAELPGDAPDLWKNLKSGNVFGKVFPVPAGAASLYYGSSRAFDRTTEQGKENNRRALMIGGNNAVQALQFHYKTLGKIKDLLDEGFPAKQEAWQKSWEVRATETRDNDVPEAERTGQPQQRFYVYEKGSRWRLAKGGQDGGYATQEQAEAFARSLTQKKREQLPPSRGLDLADVRRTGPDWRGGKNVTAKDIMEHFGFRGVNLGEYVKAKQTVAQAHLNHVYDAMADLADLLGVPPKAMSLNGTLGVAIGAQGSGKALAHFVPGVNEINITRDSGAGALAHEFGHALDHYFAAQHGKAVSMGKRPYLSAAIEGMSDAGGVRPEVIEAMRHVMRTINTRPMTEAEAKKYMADQRELNQRRMDRWVKEFKGNRGADAAALNAVAEKLKRGDVGEPQDTDVETNLAEFMRAAGLKPGNAIAANAFTTAYRLRDLADEARFMASHIPQQPTDYARASDAMDAKKQGDGYWSTPWEKFARAFETFAMDALKDRERESLYLSGLVDSAGWRNWSEATGKSIPYPAGDERLAMQQAFQSLVDTIETRDTDDGNVAMFSRSQSAPRQNAERLQQLIDVVSAQWENAPPIIVVQDLQDPKVPQEVRDEDAKQRKGGATGEPEGLYYKGKVYLIASQIGDARGALRVMFHETLGHHGLRHTFGRELGVILERLAQLNPGKVRAKARQYGLDFDKQSERRQAAEEVLAEMAQENPGLGFVQRAIAAIRSFLRRVVPGFQAMQFSDAEIIRDFILPARAWVEGGQETTFQRQPAPAFGREPSMSRTDTEAFKRWFGDSKVVDANGKPLVVYHGTTTPKDFAKFKAPAYFSSRAEGAQLFGEDAAMQDVDVEDDGSEIVIGSRLIPVHLAIRNPLRVRDWGEFMEWDARRRTAAEKKGYDGATITMPDGEQMWIAFRPEQIKSAIGNRGTFDPNDADIRFSRASEVLDTLRSATTAKGMANMAADLMQSDRSFNWWHRTIGTQFQKAKADADFGRVYEAAQDYLHDTSAFANDAAALAPDVVPQLKGWRDAFKSLRLDDADQSALASMVFQGTLVDERVYTDDELRLQFKATDRQIKLYRQFRAAVDRSLDTLVATDVARYIGRDIPPSLKAMISDGDLGRFRGLVTAFAKQKRQESEKALADVRKANRKTMSAMWDAQKKRLEGTKPGSRLAIEQELENEQAAIRARVKASEESAKAEAERWADFERKTKDKYERIDELQEKGYAPLMRFGQYTVYVTGPEGEQEFFGLYESQADANRAAREFRESDAYKDSKVVTGVLSQEAYKQFSGVAPETLEIFGELAGAERTPLFEQYLKLTKSNRSALKRLISRKGIAGYSEDTQRVLASFLTSNARASSGNLHLGDMTRLVADIPKQKGDVKDEAIKLQEYVQNPTEEAQRIRGLLFVQYLGGSLASALVNMTQPFMMTFPYLSQFGGAGKAAARLGAAMKQAMTKQTGELGRALAKAEKEGIVSPQELHQLQAEASRTMGNHPGVRRLLFTWGAAFSLAEQFNRRVSFIAAWNTAREQGIEGAFEFASKAVDETQGVYNRGNRPNWARGPVGATLFTFKQYSISYLEFLKRLPPQQRAIALMVLFLAAGAEGLPFAEDLTDLMDTIGQALGYDTNTKAWRNKVLADAIGDEAADFALHGFSAMPGFPLDVSGRLALSNLIPGTGVLLKHKTDKSGEVFDVLGPAGGLVRDALKGEFRPLAIRNLDKGLSMYQTGEYRDTRDRRVVDVDGLDAAVKAIGFQPAEVARESRKLQQNNQQVQLARVVEGEIAAEWAQGIADKEPDKVRSAKQRLEQWNRDNPRSRIAINSGQLQRRVRELRMTRQQRFEKTVPREMRSEV